MRASEQRFNHKYTIREFIKTRIIELTLGFSKVKRIR